MMKQETKPMFDEDELGIVRVRKNREGDIILTYPKGAMVTKPVVGEDGQPWSFGLYGPDGKDFLGIVWCW